MSKHANKDYVDQLHEYGLYFPTRTLYMGSEHSDEDMSESGCDYLMLERIVKNLHILDTLSREPITILMNNPGGDEYEGMAIYDAIRACQSDVKIIVCGHAMSMGSIILQAADERIMRPNARIMIHYGTPIVANSDLHTKTQEKWTEESKKFDKLMEKIYLDKIRDKHPDFSLDKLQKMLDHDSFFTAEESVEIGLADRVL